MPAKLTPARDDTPALRQKRQRATSLNVAKMNGLSRNRRRGGIAGPDVVIDEGPKLPPLPAAVEVAAYRIATEAITNAIRHAGARHCRVRIVANTALEVEVTDDGHGWDGRLIPGVGIQSMRERAADLGGTLTIEPVPGGGTSVLARLPLTTGSAS